MRYVGLDVHLRQSTICVLDQRGRKIASKTIHGPWRKVRDEIAQIRRPFAICFEASVGYGFTFEQLTDLASADRGRSSWEVAPHFSFKTQE